MNRIIAQLLILLSGCILHHVITYKREQFQPSCQIPNDSFLFILYGGMEGGDYWFIVDSAGNILGLL